MGFASRPNSRNAAGLPGTRGSVGPHFPQLDGQMIKEFVGDFSSHIKYWKAQQCPCTTSATGQPNIACRICRGLGWAYSDHEKADIYQSAQVHSRRSQRVSEAGGMITQGYASMTFRPGIIPGEGDLVQVCADVEVVNDETNIVGAVLSDGSSGETLRFRDVKCIERVAVINAKTSEIYFLMPNEYEYLTEQRIVKLNRPVGTKYSVRYQAVPEYILRQETSKPLLRVTHDDNFNDPQRYGGKPGIDTVQVFNCQGIRLDRAIIQRQRGALDAQKKEERGAFR